MSSSSLKSDQYINLVQILKNIWNGKVIIIIMIMIFTSIPLGLNYFKPIRYNISSIISPYPENKGPFLIKVQDFSSQSYFDMFINQSSDKYRLRKFLKNNKYLNNLMKDYSETQKDLHINGIFVILFLFFVN